MITEQIETNINDESMLKMLKDRHYSELYMGYAINIEASVLELFDEIRVYENGYELREYRDTDIILSIFLKGGMTAVASMIAHKEDYDGRLKGLFNELMNSGRVKIRTKRKVILDDSGGEAMFNSEITIPGKYISLYAYDVKQFKPIEVGSGKDLGVVSCADFLLKNFGRVETSD